MGFTLFRCNCSYCEFCKNSALIYDECEECYEGKHPHLAKIKNDFHNYLEDLKHSSLILFMRKC